MFLTARLQWITPDLSTHMFTSFEFAVVCADDIPRLLLLCWACAPRRAPADRMRMAQFRFTNQAATPHMLLVN
jgi:hypothetical protein